MVCPKYSNVVVVGLARDEAPETVSSVDIEACLAPTIQRLKLPKNLLATLTGIISRRLYPLDYSPSQVAALAAERLFADLNFDRHQVELLYSTSVCRDHIEPSTASVVQYRLGLLGHVKSLDVGSACLGFIDGMELAALAIESGLVAHALVVAGENSRPILENTINKLLEPDVDRVTFFRNFATLTLGSGGAALLLGSRESYPLAPRLVGSVSRSDATFNHLCRGDDQGMETDSTALLTAGVNLAQETFQLGVSELGWSPDLFQNFICHQVSGANTRKFCQSLGLDENKLVKTFPEYGNMGPVAVPFTLDLAQKKGLLAPGSRVALMGIGSGLGCSMMELIWA